MIPQRMFEEGGLFHDRGITDPVLVDGRFIYYSHDSCNGHPVPKKKKNETEAETEARLNAWREWPCIMATFSEGERPFETLALNDQEMIRDRIIQAPGIVMIRSRVSDDLADVVPEMRPEWEVLAGKITDPHRHTAVEVAASPVLQRHVAKMDPKDHPLDELLKTRYGRTWKRRLYGTMRPSVDLPMQWRKADGTIITGSLRKPLDIEPMRIPIIGRHNGENMDGWHRHRRMAKYLFSRQPDAEPRPWSHTHAESFTSSAYRDPLFACDQHMLSSWHSDSKKFSVGRFRWDKEPTVDWWVTEHEHTSPTKSDVPLAQRLTIAPKARDLLAKIKNTDDGDVFIAAESCLKETAILQAILDEGRRATVVSYPSVTLYPDELDTFAVANFRGLRVWLVPDNDWAWNQQVRTQMFVARERLRRVLGHDAVHIAAPPLVGFDENGKPIKLGADDALAREFMLDDFVVLDRDLGSFDDYIAWKYADGTRRRGADTVQAEVVTWMALLSDETGTSEVTDKSIARYAWPDEWAVAEAADLAAGHDPRTNRETITARDALRKSVSRVTVAMYKKGVRKPALTVTREDVRLDDDGQVHRVNGQVLKIKTRQIVPDLWQRLQGRQYTIGYARS